MLSQKLKEKVLLVSVGTKPCNFILNTVEHLGYETVVAESVDKAKDKILFSDFKMIFAENKLSDGSAFDVLNFVRGLSKVPFILISEALEEKEHEGNEFLNFISLARPFREADLLDTIDKIMRKQGASLVLNGARYDNVEEEFSVIDIEEFISGKEIKYDIFINIGERKFIKLSHGNESLTDDQVERLKLKGVSHLYMKKKDFIEYFNMTVSLIKHMPKVKISPHKKSLFVQMTSKLLAESVISHEIDAEVVNHASAVVESTIDMLTGCDEILLTLEFLKNGHRDVYSHCLNVSIYSVMIARNMKLESNQNLSLLAAGAMFHDLGKLKVPSAILDIPYSDLSPSETQLLQNHIVFGVEMVRSLKNIPREVVTIVEQHHECENGSGYPMGISSEHIHPLAKIVKIADDFCEHMAMRPPSINYVLHSISMMEKDASYDRDCVNALKKCFTRKKNRAA